VPFDTPSNLAVPSHADDKSSLYWRRLCDSDLSSGERTHLLRLRGDNSWNSSSWRSKSMMWSLIGSFFVSEIEAPFENLDLMQRHECMKDHIVDDAILWIPVVASHGDLDDQAQRYTLVTSTSVLHAICKYQRQIPRSDDNRNGRRSVRHIAWRRDTSGKLSHPRVNRILRARSARNDKLKGAVDEIITGGKSQHLIMYLQSQRQGNRINVTSWNGFGLADRIANEKWYLLPTNEIGQSRKFCKSTEDNDR